jgi:hypothetical protein
MAYGEHKAVLWGKLVTTAPATEGCKGCTFSFGGDGPCESQVEQRLAGFSYCSGEAPFFIYIEAKEDQPASATQVGGDHYAKRAIQPWDYIAANGLGFFEGNAVKYLTRWKDKGGIEDLKKARHYLDKLIEMEGGGNAS